MYFIGFLGVTGSKGGEWTAGVKCERRGQGTGGVL